MEKEKWADWVKKLHAWKLHRAAAALMEGLGPFHIVGAQILYISQPILSAFISPQSAYELAGILEDPETTGRFLNALRTYDNTT